MGTVNNNGGTLISFSHPNNSLHVVNSRIPSHHHNGCANFTFQIPSIANTSKRNANSAERRANHNAVERARRECLNTKFQELAHALPSLSQVRRPSKSIIVQKSLEFINNVRRKESLLEKEMQDIRTENESLREEVNRLRKQLGMEPLPPPPPPSSPLTRKDSKPSNNSSNTSSPLPSPLTSSTSSPHLQQLTDESKEDVGTSKITTTMMLQSSETINLEADNHIITSVTPTTTIIHDNNIISNNINAMNNNHNNNTNSANIIIGNTTTTANNNNNNNNNGNNNNGNNNNCNGNCNGNSNCGDNNAGFVNIKTEQNENKQIEDDYDIMDISEKLNDKNLLADQNINNSHVIYNGLIYPTLLNSSIDQHTGYSPGFDFAMDMSQIDQMIVPDPLQIQFDHSEITDTTDDLSAYCTPFSLNQKIYPSPPPCEASIISGISEYQMLHDNPNI